VSGAEPRAAELSPRGTAVCRGCGAYGLEPILDLGLQPLANELLPLPDSPTALFPLHLMACAACGLGQVGEFVVPERIFSDYPYLSSVSTSWVAHAKAYAAAMQSALGLNAESLVVEVASNDGYLLREFLALGVPVLGIEPAANVAEIARASGVRTLTAFFGRDTARAVLAEHGHPRLIAANNVMAHVPDLDDFVAGFALLCDDQTVITVENPSFVTLLHETQFDTIYHEHFSYLSAHAVARVVAAHGLQLVRIEDLATHGGSYRYTIVRQGSRAPDDSVGNAIERELSGGLLSPATWSAFAERSRATITGLRAWLDERAARGERVAGYGAAAKGNTLLNAANVHASDIAVVADGSSEKQGKYLPGTRIPVIAPGELAGYEPADVLILPWNIAAEIGPIISQLTPGARRWVAVPELSALDS
jgi:C-methyltransferase C-terminal domain/Putative zinc binding domain/Methyltransferase domain